MTHTITAQDGTGDDTTPHAITRWDPSSTSGNIVHRMLTPGAIGVVLRGDYPRAGRLTLGYTDDTEADTARVLLGRACVFSLESTTRAVIDMAFIRDGEMSTTIHDTVTDLWTFEVGFQEVTP